MQQLCSRIHPDLSTPLTGKQFTRKAARAIVLNGEDILMLYTKRYHDYTLPGGGVNDNESIEAALVRELKEETGAHVHSLSPFGLYEEYRPWYKADYDIMHMLSYCFICQVSAELGETQLEDYEIHNGMKAVWINIFDAINHNQATIANSDKKGLSIERETFLLKAIVKQLVKTSHPQQQIA